MAGTSSDWVEILEPRSRERMYVNLASGECGWDPPLGAPVRQADGNQWWELFDPHSGRFYYYNSVGRRTVWHRPQGGDIVPLSQLQAMKRCTEGKRPAGTAERQQHHGTTGSIGSVGSQGRRTPLTEQDRETPLPRAPETTEKQPADPDLEPAADSRSQGDGSSTERSTDGSKEPQRDPSQRWQPPPGSKAAMLVKVNSMSRSQPSPASQQHVHHGAHSKGSVFTLHPSSNKSPGGHLSSTQGYKTAPSGKMAADTRQAHHLRKVSNGSFCLVTSESGHPSPLLHRSQTSTPRPVSPQYGCTVPLYDDPVSECPIYDEPPIDMEVEGAHLHNGPSLSRLTPTHSLQKPRLLQHPGSSHSGSRHKRNPSASDYSPAGLECIKHMVNVDPKLGHLSGSPVPTRSPSPTSRQDPLLPQHQPHPQHQAQSQPQARGQPRDRDREPGTPGPGTLEKKQGWRALEATVQRAMEARHSRQSSQASQDFPTSTPQATATYQDSGYSTGPSPSLRRKSRRRVGAGGGAGGRPGSVGSTGELCALNERLMAEMREVVSRSNTMREVRAGLDPEMGERAVVVPRTRSPADSLRWYGGGGAGTAGSAGRCSSREDIAGAGVARSLGRAGTHGNPALTSLDIPGRQKRTYEKVDTLEKSITSQASLSSPETPGPPSQTGTLDLQAQLESRKKGMVDGRTASLGPHRPAAHDNREGGDGGGGRAGGSSYQLSYATLRQPPPPDTGMEDWASKHLNMHTQGLFRRRVSIANMLSWNRGSIKKPMLVTSNRAVRKEACEMFKLVQAYMGDRPSRLDRRHCALLIVTKCWDMPGLRDELYVQLVRQTTGNISPRSLAAGWELMAVSLAFFAPSPKFRCYLEGYIQRHTEPASDKKLTQFILEQQELKLKKNSKSRKKRKANTEEDEGLPISTYAKFCYRKLQKVAITGGKKGLRKPTLEEIDHSRRAIVTPSLFGSSLEEVMERQSELFPDRKLPWVQVQLSQYVLALGGAQTEGIFRVPGDIDEVNALKLQVDQWRIPENLSDPNVPASLMKLWYRELEEPLIPMNFYKQCVSNYDDPVSAIAVVQSLPELNRLVLCYFIHFLQVFAQPANVAVTKMDVNNLAMVMAPNCLRCQSDDPRVIFENTRKEMSFLRMLIVHLDTSFIEGVV
ncbi:rho GTPase-activating protein 39 isoform 2-T2 [Polymixia lowei]